MANRICKDCAKCTESAASALAKKSANAMLIVSTAGLSVLASKTGGAFRRKCPACGHMMSEHQPPETFVQQNYNYVQPAPPPAQQVVQVVVQAPHFPVPAQPPQPQPPQAITCQYCRRTNAPGSYSCMGCGAQITATPTAQASAPLQQAFCPHCQGGNPPAGLVCQWCHRPMQ
jgi:hypothetical protein